MPDTTQNWWETDSLAQDTTISDTTALPKIELPDTALITPTPPPKKEVQPEPIRQHLTDPAVYLAVADMEAGDRATRHNNFSAHIVPSDSTLRQELINKYGMEVGDSFVDSTGATHYTAKYPNMEQGNAASEYIIDSKWAANDGVGSIFCSNSS